jgi:hypothetical protein
MERPSDILNAAVARKTWTTGDLHRALGEHGVDCTPATVRNWLGDRAVPTDTARLALVRIFGLERDGFLAACTSASAKREW